MAYIIEFEKVETLFVSDKQKDSRNGIFDPVTNPYVFRERRNNQLCLCGQEKKASPTPGDSNDS